MRRYVAGVATGMVLMAFLPVTRAEHAGYPAPAYASAAQVSAALRQIGANNDDRAVLQLDPYVVRAEHRAGTEPPGTPASIHEGMAELYVVTAGSATLVTGSEPSDAHAGASLHISQGDIVIIPENTPHWFSAIDGSISYLSMHMPRASSAK